MTTVTGLPALKYSVDSDALKVTACMQYCRHHVGKVRHTFVWRSPDNNPTTFSGRSAVYDAVAEAGVVAGSRYFWACARRPRCRRFISSHCSFPLLPACFTCLPPPRPAAGRHSLTAGGGGLAISPPGSTGSASRSGWRRSRLCLAYAICIVRPAIGTCHLHRPRHMGAALHSAA